MDRKVFDKRKPGADEKFFIPLPSDTRHYIHHDKMNADKMFLYALIIDHYNPIDGYAFPSIETLALKYGKVPDTTRKHLDDLKEVGLIDFPEKGYYVPLVPLTEDEFFGVFPSALENLRIARNKSDTRRQAAKERMREWREKKGYTD